MPSVLIVDAYTIAERFEVPVTFRVSPRTERTFMVVTLVLARLEADVTLRVLARTESAFMVVTLVVERFDAEVTFRVAPEIEETFRVVTLVVDRFADPDTFMRVMNMLDDVRALVRYALPTTYNCVFVGGVVPMPTFEVTTTVIIFAVLKTFTLVVKTFWVRKPLETYVFP